MGVSQQRFIRRAIFPGELPSFFDLLRKEGLQVQAVSNVQSIYFGNAGYPLPFGTSFGVQRRTEGPASIVLDKESIFVSHEGDFGEEAFLLVQKNESLCGKDILAKLNDLSLATLLERISRKHLLYESGLFSDVPITPFIATQCNQETFAVSGGLEGTINANIGLYEFKDPRGEAIPLKGYKIAVVELRLEDSKREDLLSRLVSTLDDLGGFSTVSPKYMALNRWVGRRNSEILSERPLMKEIPHAEYELKWNIEGFDSGLLFLLLKQGFGREEGGFIQNPDNPYSWDRAAVHTYFQQGDECVKVCLMGNKFKLSKKNSDRGKERVLRRDESRTEYAWFSSWKDTVRDLGKNIGELIRFKKCFYVVNQSSDRIYQVAVDCSYSGSSCLSQVEAEYSGRRNGRRSETAEVEVEAELELLKNRIESLPSISPYIRPSRLSKQEWLISLNMGKN
ncbi:MAG: hypothetical protein AABX70_06720 [Nanoarchaeota archaeon]